MTEVQTILEMIEGADPEDAKTLNEIDGRVWCWLNGKIFKWPEGKKRFHFCHPEWPQEREVKRISNDIAFTRSRDALKAIRPEGWHSTAIAMYATSRQPEGVEWEGYCTKPDFSKYHPYETSGWIKRFSTDRHLPSEQLAELHAIIQAIDYEGRK